MGIQIQGVEVGQAGLAQADAAFTLVEEYFQAAGVEVREDRGQFRREYFGPGRGFWLARADGELAGCVGLRATGDRASAEIKRMYVREKFRGRGIARSLLHSAEKFARTCGYAWIYLDTTSEMVAAAGLYEQNGYRRCQRYNQNPQATIFMRKSLTG